MSYIIIFILIIFLIKLIILKLITANIDIFSKNKSLENILNVLPNNISICKQMLLLLNNPKTTIEKSQNTKSKTSYYLHMTSKIILSNHKEAESTYARPIFIAHECIHSNQSKNYMWLNFLTKTIFIVYLLTTTVYCVFETSKNINIYLLIGFIILLIIKTLTSLYLEVDAMYGSLKLAKVYLEQILEKNNFEIILNSYENVMEKVIPTYYQIELVNFITAFIIYIMILAL